MIWFLLSATVYIVIGFFVSKAIGHIRTYDWNRSSRTKHPRMCSSQRVGDDENVAFWSGIAWAPIGLMCLLWHLHQVSWTKEERKLMRQVDKEQGVRKTVTKLESLLEKRKQERLQNLRSEINRLESQ